MVFKTYIRRVYNIQILSRDMKKGVSSIIASVLLIGITVTLASIILVWGNLFFVALSPPSNCGEIEFRAAIYNNGHLDLVNDGNREFLGAVINQIGNGEITQLYEVILGEPLPPGYSNTKELPQNISGNLLIVPIVQIPGKTNATICPDRFGIEISS